MVYVREGVAVWPTRSERIVGRLSLIRQHRVLFLSWLPYAPGALAPDGVFTPTPADAPPSSPARGAPTLVLAAVCAGRAQARLRVVRTSADMLSLSLCKSQMYEHCWKCL